MTDLSLPSQVGYVILTGAGLGLMLGPTNTDAVNLASRPSYGEATGITQTVRNYAASLSIAVLGTILVTMLRSDVTSSLIAMGVPGRQAAAQAARIAQSQAGGSTAAALVAGTGLRAGRQEEPGEAGAVPGPPAPHKEAGTRP
jgi:hypothetical protein